MTYLKSTILALAAACALSAPALAQGEGIALRERQARMMMSDGRWYDRNVNDQALYDSMVLKGRPLTAGHVVVMSGGKHYLVDDYRMPDGKMMSEHLMSSK